MKNRLEEIRNEERLLRKEKKDLLVLEKLETIKEKSTHCSMNFYSGTKRNYKWVYSLDLFEDDLEKLQEFLIELKKATR